MTYPAAPPPYPTPYGWGPPPDPGPIPLRPMRLGDLLGTGIGVVRRHLGILGPVAAGIAALGAGAHLWILQATGSLELFATGEWVQAWQRDIDAGEMAALPMGLYLSVVVRSLISVLGVFVLAGIAAACISGDAVGRRASPGAVAARMRGTVGPLLIASVLLTLGILIGSLVFLIPAVLAYVFYALSAPAAVMERASAAAALARSVRLSRGHRWRILGVTVVVVVITAVIEAIVSGVVTALIPSLGAIGSLIVSDIVVVIVSAMTASWVAAVIALLYVDIRVRTENLGESLRAYAARNQDSTQGSGLVARSGGRNTPGGVAGS